MASNIDPTQPEQGNPTTLAVRGNFQSAKDEIESLQTRADNLEAGTSIAYATTTAQGVVELATTAEIDAGLDATRAIVPSTLAASQLQTDASAALAASTTNTSDITALQGITVTAGTGLTGGGNLTASFSLNVGAGTGITVNADDVALDTASFLNVDHSLVTVTAGNGLTGGGTIAASRTLNVGAGTGITVAADSVAFDTAWGDARYLGTAGKAADSNLLDGLDSSQFLRSDTADIKTSGHLTFNDNIYSYWGTGDDCRMFFNGSHLFLDVGVVTTGANFYIRDGATTRFTFEDDGSFTATGNITAYSDKRLKKNVSKIEGAIEKVQALAGCTYQRVDLEDRQMAGVIAQDVQKVLPEAITEDPETGFLSVDYGAVTALVLQAVNELIEEVRG